MPALTRVGGMRRISQEQAKERSTTGVPDVLEVFGVAKANTITTSAGILNVAVLE